ncbi:MAG TPA: PDZ domain-containing protein [Planctomicrobium sp.]|nr:PDZ domain-containing protein [Planctomicrobium sp.]
MNRGCVTLLALLCCATVLNAVLSSVNASEPSLKTLPKEVQSLLTQLSGSSFRERVAAQRELQAFVQREPQRVAEIIPLVEPEAQLRLVRILEESFLSNDNTAGDNAERALDEIRHSDAVVANDAEMVLIGNSRLREGRARREIERLGGRLAYTVPVDPRAPATAPRVGVGFGDAAVLQTILISEDWTGTPEDFWHLRRLEHNHNVTLYNIRSNRLNLEDLISLGSDLPGLMVHERGAFLGVRGAPTEATMVVSEIVANSAAEIADLRPRDQILKLDSHIVRNFSHLVELLLDYAPGQTIQLKVRRDGELIDLPVKLSSWKQMPLTSQSLEVVPQFFPGPLGQGRPVPPEMPHSLFDHRPERIFVE